VTRLLWADDDKQLLQDNIPLLARYGLRIDPAYSGPEALSLLERSPSAYSGLIVDLDMQEMNGVELIRRVRVNHPTIEIMLVSAHVDEPVWTPRLETLQESLQSIPKTFPMITSPKFGEIVEKFRNLGRGGELGNLLASETGQEPAPGLDSYSPPAFAASLSGLTWGNDPVVNSRSEALEMTSTEIPALYTQIRELVSRSKDEPELRDEIQRRIERLRRLQEAEADEFERRFEERLRLKSGTGWAFLQRMKERLGDA
jgi:CheY-like chemotaxis protein